MGNVMSGRRGYHGGKPLTRDLPCVSLVRGMTDIQRLGRPLLLVEAEHAIVIHGTSMFKTEIATTALHLGGTRKWLVCPGCGGRSQNLYIATESLACRRCAGLRYPTQTMNRRYRFIEKADGLRRRLGWSTGVLRPWGERPKRMRMRTFNRLTGELQAVEEALLQDLSAWAERALARPLSSR